MSCDVAERRLHALLGHVHRHAFHDEEGPLRLIVAVTTQDVSEIVVLNVDRDVGEVGWWTAERFVYSLFLQCLRGRTIDLEDPHIREQLLTAIGVRVEAGPENDDVLSTAFDGALERLIDEPRA